MTDYADMKPAEIDALVAERVMGWRQDTYGFWRDGPAGAESFVHQEWSPSTSIADAWEVVERMAELNFRVSLCQLTRDPHWLVRFEDAITEKTCGEFWSSSPVAAPLAICIAALRALDQ